MGLFCLQAMRGIIVRWPCAGSSSAGHPRDYRPPAMRGIIVRRPCAGSSSPGLNLFPKCRIELLFFDKFLQCQMHPVPPIVMGIGRDIDPFVMRVLAAEMLAHTHDILQLKNTPLGR